MGPPRRARDSRAPRSGRSVSPAPVASGHGSISLGCRPYGGSISAKRCLSRSHCSIIRVCNSEAVIGAERGRRRRRVGGQRRRQHDRRRSTGGDRYRGRTQRGLGGEHRIGNTDDTDLVDVFEKAQSAAIGRAAGEIRDRDIRQTVASAAEIDGASCERPAGIEPDRPTASRQRDQVGLRRQRLGGVIRRVRIKDEPAIELLLGGQYFRPEIDGNSRPNAPASRR